MFSKPKIERHRRDLAGSFAQWLTDTQQEDPRPGFYTKDGTGGWEYLEGESPTSQERRFDAMTDSTVFTFGVRVEVVDDGTLTVSPNLVAVP